MSSDHRRLQALVLRAYLATTRFAHPEYRDAIDRCLNDDDLFHRFHDRCLDEYSKCKSDHPPRASIDPESFLEFCKEYILPLLQALAALVVILASEPNRLDP